MIDGAKRLTDPVRDAIKRLSKVSFDPEDRRVIQAMQDDSFTEEAFTRGQYSMTASERELAGSGHQVTLVLNKVDLITNKRKLRSLQSELEDLCRFEAVFHVSCETGFGMKALQDYMLQNAI